MTKELSKKLEEIRAQWAAENAALMAILAKYGFGEPQCGSDCQPGWLPIVDEALGALKAAGYTGQISQIKQKFCGLRIYLSEYPIKPEWEKTIAEAVEKAWLTCESCGNAREYKGPTFGRGLCKDCAPKNSSTET